MLRNLSSYYGKDAAGLHLVRVAQGMLHMGKGLTTINPYHSDRQLLSPLALASLLTVLHCGTNPTATLCGKPAYMLYYMVPAVRPRMLLTVDESGDVIPASVRVGTAVDTVAQAGQPKSITGTLLPSINKLLFPCFGLSSQFLTVVDLPCVAQVSKHTTHLYCWQRAIVRRLQVRSTWL